MNLAGRLRALVVLLLAGLVFAGEGRAVEGRNTSAYARQVVAGLPAYAPRPAPAGVIRLWGHGSFSRPFMRLLVARWMKGFA
ncbi:MAG: hypothetical protein ABI222_15115, partial [Opitutaceae bacterium]